MRTLRLLLDCNAIRSRCIKSQLRLHQRTRNYATGSPETGLLGSQLPPATKVEQIIIDTIKVRVHSRLRWSQRGTDVQYSQLGPYLLLRTCKCVCRILLQDTT